MVKYEYMSRFCRKFLQLKLDKKAFCLNFAACFYTYAWPNPCTQNKKL